ncbi:hypothetical protein Bca101_057833 [Brassica carinata]
MMVEDLCVQAKEAALPEVAKLLPLPMLLQYIYSIKVDCIARQQASYAQLSTMVSEQESSVSNEKIKKMFQISFTMRYGHSSFCKLFSPIRLPSFIGSKASKSLYTGDEQAYHAAALHSSFSRDDFGRDERLDLDDNEPEYDDDEYSGDGEFADKIGDGLTNLRVKVIMCMLMKKSSLEKLQNELLKA